jgi:hypothetical protein
MKPKFRIMSKKTSYGHVRYWIEVYERTTNMFFNRYAWREYNGMYDTYEEAERRVERKIHELREEAVILKEAEEYGMKVHKVFEVGNE